VSDHDALLAAICDSPDDDTPRLIYADFLEESGESDRAEFVRAQVELARTPDWEPFAVRCRGRGLEWSEAGAPFRGTLPPLGPELAWRSEPFRRGLGWRVEVSNLRAWAAIAPRLWNRAPIGEWDLRAAATRDEWQTFAESEWASRFRVMHLHGGSPVEPIRALCSNPAATGITDIHFHRASSPGLPELVEDLLATPLGQGLRGLHFAVGYQSLDHLVDALAESTVRLDRLSFRTMGMTAERLGRLLEAPICSELRTLELSKDRHRTDDEGGAPEWPARLPETLTTLRIEDGFLRDGDLEVLALDAVQPRLRVLDLSHDYNVRYAGDIFDADFVRELRSLVLRDCRLLPEAWRKLVQSAMWMNLVEVDVRGSAIGDAACRRLVQAPMPPDLTALRIDRPENPHHLELLESHFGERLVVTASASAG